MPCLSPIILFHLSRSSKFLNCVGCSSFPFLLPPWYPVKRYQSIFTGREKCLHARFELGIQIKPLSNGGRTTLTTWPCKLTSFAVHHFGVIFLTKLSKTLCPLSTISLFFIALLVVLFLTAETSMLVWCAIFSHKYLNWNEKNYIVVFFSDSFQDFEKFMDVSFFKITLVLKTNLITLLAFLLKINKPRISFNIINFIMHFVHAFSCLGEFILETIYGLFLRFRNYPFEINLFKTSP